MNFQDVILTLQRFWARKGCVLVVNKWDLAEEADGITQTQYEPALRKEMPFLDFAPLLFISAHSGYNVKRSIDTIDYVAAQVETKLTTGVLNRVIQDAVAKNPPPIIKGRPLKIYYATQSGAKPIFIKLFVNNTLRATDTYKRYLVNQLRAAFGLEGAPVILKLVPRPRPDLEEKKKRG